MRQRWFSLTASGWNDLVAGYTREGLHEQALEALDEMRKSGIPIQGWLHDMLVYAMCDVNEIDEALTVMKYRVWTGEHTASASAWYYLFDTACRHLHVSWTHPWLWSC